MYTGQIISGAGHAVLILWLLLGDFLFSPPEPEQLEATNVSMISSAELAAMQAAAAGALSDAPAEAVPDVQDPLPDPVVEPPPPEPAVEPPPPEPVVEAPPPEPVIAETPPEPVVETGPTGEAAPQPLPPSDDPQPIPSPLADARPRPRPADLVAPVPVEETPDVETSPTPEQAVSEQPTEDAVIVEEPPVEETAPEAAATELVPEQLDAPEVATLAPATSPRPRARPEPVAEPADVPEEPVAEATEPTPDPATDQAAIDEALAAALAEETAPAEEPATEAPPTGAGGTPLGQALTAGELGDFRAQVQQRWNVGALSTEALAVSVTIAVTVGPDGVPDAGSVRMVAAGGGSDAAINAAYEVAKRAILTAGRRGLALPLDKYETWRELEITFDASSRRLR